ncbi:MAG: hypothetical protein J6A28_01680 [Clostridia bacterium]|nr:hypothetical protein [Clostridia bacterium]
MDENLPSSQSSGKNLHKRKQSKAYEILETVGADAHSIVSMILKSHQHNKDDLNALARCLTSFLNKKDVTKIDFNKLSTAKQASGQYNVLLSSEEAEKHFVDAVEYAAADANLATDVVKELVGIIISNKLSQTQIFKDYLLKSGVTGYCYTKSDMFKEEIIKLDDAFIALEKQTQPSFNRSEFISRAYPFAFYSAYQSIKTDDTSIIYSFALASIMEMNMRQGLLDEEHAEENE